MEDPASLSQLYALKSLSFSQGTMLFYFDQGFYFFVKNKLITLCRVLLDIGSVLILIQETSNGLRSTRPKYI